MRSSLEYYHVPITAASQEAGHAADGPGASLEYYHIPIPSASQKVGDAVAELKASALSSDLATLYWAN